MKTHHKIIALIPLMIASLFLGFFLWALINGKDPNQIPSTHIGKAIPQTTIKPIPNYARKGFSYQALKKEPIALVNFFASWCLPCRAEHSTLGQIAKHENIPIYGINYKDQSQDIINWLDELGDVYTQIGFDHLGKSAIIWGITGVPESFIIKNGIITYRFQGPIIGVEGKNRLMRAIQDNP